jgi:hypothetical protein
MNTDNEVSAALPRIVKAKQECVEVSTPIFNKTNNSVLPRKQESTKCECSKLKNITSDEATKIMHYFKFNNSNSIHSLTLYLLTLVTCFMIDTDVVNRL